MHRRFRHLHQQDFERPQPRRKIGRPSADGRDALCRRPRRTAGGQWRVRTTSVRSLRQFRDQPRATAGDGETFGKYVSKDGPSGGGGNFMLRVFKRLRIVARPSRDVRDQGTNLLVPRTTKCVVWANEK